MEMDSIKLEIFFCVLFLCAPISLGLLYIYGGINLCKRKGIVVKGKVIMAICSFPVLFFLVGSCYKFDSNTLLSILFALIFMIFALTSNKIKYGLLLYNFTEDELYDCIFAVFEKSEIEYDFRKGKRYSKLIFRNIDASMTVHLQKYIYCGDLWFTKPKNIPAFNNLANELQRSLNGREFKGTLISGIIATIMGLLFTTTGLFLLYNILTS